MIGRMLEDNLTNLGLIDDARAFFKNKNIDFSGVVHSEQDAALGNGGLGRLAACFMDSMSTTGVAGMGYGIRYQHGIFRQNIEDGWHTILNLAALSKQMMMVKPFGSRPSAFKLSLLICRLLAGKGSTSIRCASGQRVQRI